jgi:DNA-binding CsgD family transcriptional regulator
MMDRALRARVREISEELSVLRLGAPSAISALLPAINELVELESLLVYSVQSHAGHWQIARWHVSGSLHHAEPLARRMFDRHREFPMYFTPHRPLKLHRNRLVDAQTWIEKRFPGSWEQSDVFREVFAPLRIHRHSQPRALLCDGPEMLAWFGGVHPTPATAHQRRLLASFIEPVRARLAAERRLEASHLRPTLDALLEHIGAAAFLVDARGQVYEANLAGRALLDERHADVITSIQDATAGRASALHFELVALRDYGGVRTWLAILKPSTIEPRIDACVRAAQHRLGLTPRQTDVLALVVRGKANSTIAAILECVERTVELHVTALLDRFGVDSRAGLVAATLMHD